MTRLLADIGDFCLWASSVMVVIFVIQYSVLASWWRNFIGITIVGEALALLAIYVPSLMGLADPAEFAHFAATRWYLYLTVAIVVATTLFLGTRILTWEAIRRKRNDSKAALLPSVMAERIDELETENDALRERLGET